MRGHWFALQANQWFFTKRKQKKIELCPLLPALLWKTRADLYFKLTRAPLKKNAFYLPASNGSRLSEKMFFLNFMMSNGWHFCMQKGSQVSSIWNSVPVRIVGVSLRKKCCQLRMESSIRRNRIHLWIEWKCNWQIQFTQTWVVRCRFIESAKYQRELNFYIFTRLEFKLPGFVPTLSLWAFLTNISKRFKNSLTF